MLAVLRHLFVPHMPACDFWEDLDLLQKCIILHFSLTESSSKEYTYRWSCWTAISSVTLSHGFGSWLEFTAWWCSDIYIYLCFNSLIRSVWAFFPYCYFINKNSNSKVDHMLSRRAEYGLRTSDNERESRSIQFSYHMGINPEQISNITEANGNIPITPQFRI